MWNDNPKIQIHRLETIPPKCTQLPSPRCCLNILWSFFHRLLRHACVGQRKVCNRNLQWRQKMNENTISHKQISATNSCSQAYMLQNEALGSLWQELIIYKNRCYRLLLTKKGVTKRYTQPHQIPSALALKPKALEPAMAVVAAVAVWPRHHQVRIPRLRNIAGIQTLENVWKCCKNSIIQVGEDEKQFRVILVHACIPLSHISRFHSPVLSRFPWVSRMLAEHTAVRVVS